MKIQEQITDEIREKIVDWFKRHPYPTFMEVTNFAHEIDLEPEVVMTQAFWIISTLFCGGKSVEQNIDVSLLDESELGKGVKIEAEHIDNNSPYALYIKLKITLDHLSENFDKLNPRYNSMLLLMEQMLFLGITEDMIREKFNIKKESKMNEKKIKESIDWSKFSDSQLVSLLKYYFNVPVKIGTTRNSLISDLSFIEKDIALTEKDINNIVKELKNSGDYKENKTSKAKSLKECFKLDVLLNKLDEVKEMIKTLKVSKIDDVQLKYWLEYENYLLQLMSQKIDNLKTSRDIVSQIVWDSTAEQTDIWVKDASNFIRNEVLTESLKKSIKENTTIHTVTYDLTTKTDKELLNDLAAWELEKENNVVIFRDGTREIKFIRKNGKIIKESKIKESDKKLSIVNRNGKYGFVGAIAVEDKDLSDSKFDSYQDALDAMREKGYSLFESKVKEGTLPDMTKKEILKSLQYFVDMDKKLYGEISDETIKGINKQGYTLNDKDIVVIKEAINSEDFFQNDEDWKKDSESIINYAIEKFGFLLHKDMVYTLSEFAEIFSKTYPPYVNNDNDLIFRTLTEFGNLKIRIAGLTGKFEIIS